MAIKEYPLPNTGSRPRRIAITSDDVIWYADYRAATSAGSIRRPAR